MQGEVPLLDLSAHQPPTEIYLYGNDDKLDDTDMEAETPAHGNLSMKTSQSPELIEPMAPKPFSSSGKMFTFEGLTPSNSDDEARSQTQVGEEEEAAQNYADSEYREENDLCAMPEAAPEPAPSIELQQQMQPSEVAVERQISPTRKETPKESAETPKTGSRRWERYLVDAILRKDDASENSTPFDEEPISPRGTAKSKKIHDRNAIPRQISLQQKAIEEEIIFGTTQLTIGTLDANDNLVDGRPNPCPEVQAFVASLLLVEDELTMAPTDEMEERSATNTVHARSPSRTYSSALCGEPLFDMEWCTQR